MKENEIRKLASCKKLLYYTKVDAKEFENLATITLIAIHAA